MVLDFLRSKSKRCGAQRLFAILLLSLSFVDLVAVDLFLPELCEGEGTIVAAAKAPSLTVIKSGREAAFTLTDTQQQESSIPEALEDDCFCCCSHIEPSAYFNFPNLRFQTEPSLARLAFMPTAPSIETYHPPRSA